MFGATRSRADGKQQGLDEQAYDSGFHTFLVAFFGLCASLLTRRVSCPVS